MMTKPLTAWSFSRYDCYRLCPAKFKYQFLDKRDQGPTPEPLLRGRKVHDAAAAYVMGKGPAPEVEYQVDLMDEIRQFDDKVVEQQWGFTKNWTPTGWFGKDTWLRSTLDVGIMYEDMTVEVVDWKTGKKWGESEEQMELYAVSVFCRQQPVTHVTARLAYVDSGDQVFADFERSELPGLIDKWNGKVAPMFAETEFLPRPNDKCRFCPFSKTNGGPCSYG